ALVSVPSIGKPLLGEAEFANLQASLQPGDSALLIVGRGIYSFKGSGMATAPRRCCLSWKRTETSPCTT
ncbi:hypothetical protein ACXWQV_10040, partial [Streptococcus pyogenes]